MESSRLEQHAHLKRYLLELLASMAEIHWTLRPMTEDLAGKLLQDRFTLLIVGEFNRGKTCLVNALLEEALLPMGVTPLTSVASVLVYGDKFKATVHFLDNTKHPIERAEIPDYVTESGNPGNIKKVRDLHIEYPARVLRGGLQLIDSPGVGSIHQHNTDTAYARLPDCDAALFVLSADQPISKAELAFLNDVRAYAQKIFFLLNKIDYLDVDELEEAMDYTRATLVPAIGADVRVFPISAKMSLRSNGWMDAGLQEESGIPHLIYSLEDFLLKEKCRLLLRGVAFTCKKTLSRIKLETELVLQAIALPPDQLEEKIRAFKLHDEMLRHRRDRLLQDFALWSALPLERVLDPEINHWKSHCLKNLQTALLNHVHTLGDLSPSALDQALNQYVLEQICAASTRFKETIGPKLTLEFEEACRILGAGMTTLIDQLQRYTAGLFQLTVSAPVIETGLMIGDMNLSVIRTDPVGLEILSELMIRDSGSWMLNHFPRLSAQWRKWVKARIIRHHLFELEEGLDKASGRLREALLIQLQGSRERYSAQAIRWYEGVASGITQSLHCGLEAGRKSAMTDRLTRHALEQRGQRVAEETLNVERLCAQLDALSFPR